MIIILLCFSQLSVACFHSEDLHPISLLAACSPGIPASRGAENTQYVWPTESSGFAYVNHLYFTSQLW